MIPAPLLYPCFRAYKTEGVSPLKSATQMIVEKGLLYIYSSCYYSEDLSILQLVCQEGIIWKAALLEK
jgi:hypothetical protein